MRVVVVGSSGRLGAVLAKGLSHGGHAVTALTHRDLDVTDRRKAARAILALHPDVIVNCAAYNAVNAAEIQSQAAYRLNADGPAGLAEAADDSGAILIHFGSDFVFDGQTDHPYSEDDQTNPLSVYGLSKLAGEKAVGSIQRHYILRVASLFGGSGTNGHRATIDVFADTFRSGVTVQACTQRTVSPSYVPDVVYATVRLLETEPAYGVYHCVNSGSTTWYGLAEAVAERLHVTSDIAPLGDRQVSGTAARPKFSALSNRKLANAGIEMPTWLDALDRHFDWARTRLHPDRVGRAVETSATGNDHDRRSLYFDLGVR